MFKKASDSEISMSQLMLPSHSNFSGKIHGGYILNLMDQVAFACASKHSGNYCVTASVNRVDFLHPIEVGDLVHLKASVNYTGKSSMVIGLRVEAEKVQTSQVAHCNSSYFTMVAKNELGHKATVPGLILSNEDQVRRFARSMAQQAERKARSKAFQSGHFKLKDHLSLLENENVKLDLK